MPTDQVGMETTAGIIGLVVLFALIGIGMPIGFAMLLVGFGGVWALVGETAAFSILGATPYRTAYSYVLITIPLFVFMGEILFSSGLASDLFRAIYRWVGKVRGSLSLASIGACAGFAAVSGSSAATAATIGKVAIPEMRKYGYDNKLAAGTIATGGTLGILIPPSAMLIIYALVTQQSIGELFIAGIFPGLMTAALYASVILAVVRIRPNWAPAAATFTWKERLFALPALLPVLALFVVVIGGIYQGIWTAMEAAGAGAFIAVLITVVMRRFNLPMFWSALKGTVQTSCMIFMIVIGAAVFTNFIALSRIPMELADFITGLDLPPTLVMVGILVLYLFLGCILESLSMVLLTMPIIYPAVMELGFGPVWFGIIIVKVVEMALITPPVGVNTYVIAGIAPDIPLSDVFKGASLFLIAEFVVIAILMAAPSIATWLPATMKGG